MKSFLACLGLTALLAACGTPPSPGSDAGDNTDSGTGGGNDSGMTPQDAGGDNDAGSGFDAGGGTDAGPGDAGVTDAGACPYRYCEDFESYPAAAVTNGEVLGPWKATVSGLGVMARIDSVNPRDGRQSYHVTVPADGGTRATLNQMNAAGIIPGNNVFGRVEVFYSDAGSDGLPIAVHSWLFNASGKQSDGGTSTMNMGGGGARMQLNYHPPVGLESSVQGGTMTAGVWHCVQWQYDGSGTPPANTASVWVDGTLAFTVPASKGWTFPTPWTSFDLGFTHYQSLTNPVDVYLDDFALDGAMVPCPP